MNRLTQQFADEFERRRRVRQYAMRLSRKQDERILYGNAFVESDHPRDSLGQFTSAGAGSRSPQERSDKRAPDNPKQFIRDAFEPTFIELVQSLDSGFLRALHSLKLDSQGNMDPRARGAMSEGFLTAFDGLKKSVARDINALDGWALDAIIEMRPERVS